jgi:hypothetical protein
MTYPPYEPAAEPADPIKPVRAVEPIEPSDPTSLRAWGLSWIRTATPLLWGFLLTFVGSKIPAVRGLLDNPEVYAVIDGGITLAWYAVFRRIEHHLPAWLTRFVLGANTAPVYPSAAATPSR